MEPMRQSSKQEVSDRGNSSDPWNSYVRPRHSSLAKKTSSASKPVFSVPKQNRTYNREINANGYEYNVFRDPITKNVERRLIPAPAYDRSPPTDENPPVQNPPVQNPPVQLTEQHPLLKREHAEMLLGVIAASGGELLRGINDVSVIDQALGVGGLCAWVVSVIYLKEKSKVRALSVLLPVLATGVAINLLPPSNLAVRLVSGVVFSRLGGWLEEKIEEHTGHKLTSDSPEEYYFS